MNAQLLESLTKLTQALNLAKQDAMEANKQARPILSIALVKIISEVADLELRTAQLLEAAIAEGQNPTSP